MSKEVNSQQDWIALSFVAGVGSRTAALLIERFGSPAACLKASSAALESAGLQAESIEEIKKPDLHRRAEKHLNQLQDLGARILTLSDDDYPMLLRETYDPPIVLYSLGDFIPAVARPVVAIVGSRRCSTYGRNVSEQLARELAGRGVTIVSGLARGIDSAAHRGTIEARGVTVGVMGTGLDAIYPRENRKLADRILERGGLVTEFPLATPPISQNFPFRNRVISGLSLGVVVVEAAERSGSLITARLAYEQGREVFAVPGNITSAKSFGPNYLIRDGARLVHSWRDVVDEFPNDAKLEILRAARSDELTKKSTVSQLSNNEKRLLQFLKPDEATHIDELILRSGLSHGELTAALLNLEMQDRIRQLPGKAFARKLR